ncbi:MAG: SDR family NAD(P)-dependent oxidoreductase [Oscillospiraceae bacterium]
MYNNIKDKVIIITGASSGIGEALAKKLGEQGGKLVLAARRADRLEELVKEIRENGGTAVYQVTDVRDKNQVMALKDFALQSFGGELMYWSIMRALCRLRFWRITQPMNGIA